MAGIIGQIKKLITLNKHKMSSEGTNYRAVYKSDHLGVIDLEEMIERGTPLIFTIKEVKQLFGTKVAGKQIDANIAFFKEQVKPLVLNSTNAKVLKNLSNSSHIENWSNMRIEVYIDHSVKMKGQVVGGVRIKERKVEDKKEMNENHPKWEELKIKVQENGTTLEQIRQHFAITEENYQLLCG